MAVMADFARLSPARKVLLFVVMGGALGGLYYQFLYTKLVDDVDTAEAKQAAFAAADAKKDQELEEYKELKVRYPRLVCIVNENQKALPTDVEVSAFFETINRKINETGAQLVRSKQDPEQAIERFIKVPVTFEMTGSFLQIERFFASLQPKKPVDKPDGPPTTNGECGVEERERIVSVENLSLGDPQVKTGQIVLTARFTASTFRQEEAKDLAPPSKPSSGARAPTPPPASGGATPPAATPAGVKARVGSAMKQEEQRTDPKNADRLKGGL
jgi:Tfp pilus assembly protein PilO